MKTSTRICKKCGGLIEAFREHHARLCLKCVSKKDNSVSFRIEKILKDRELAMKHIAMGNDSALATYYRWDREHGFVNVSWRGMVPTYLRYAN